MPRLRRVPPGRAGRMWLQHRLQVAHRGARLLDQKLRILRGEQERFTLLTARTGQAWEAACREADTWLVRGAMLGGQRALRLGRPEAHATVDVSWASAMGVRHPADARCVLPEPDPTSAPLGNTALFHAQDAYRRAAQAGVDHAVAQAALRVVDAEVTATRRRLRAVEDRWVPQLEAALAEVELGLEELEHAEGVRLRWAAGRNATHAGAGEERPP
ncbi:MAG: V-type ATP synthase subunit D [Actinomycetes bacterium]